MVALSIAYVPIVARVVRTAALKERALPYIAALQVQGASGWTICLRHLLPNLLPLIVVQAAIGFGYAMLDLAAISFLGLGIQPPSPDWGVMIAGGQPAILDGNPQQSLYAALTVVVAVVSFNLVGERLARRFRIEETRMSALLEIEHLRLRLPIEGELRTAVHDVTLDGRRRRGGRPGGRVGLGQVADGALDHAAAAGRGGGRRRRARRRRSRSRMPPGASCGGCGRRRSRWSSRTRARTSTRSTPSATSSPRGCGGRAASGAARPRGARPRCCARSASTTPSGACGSGRGSCPAACCSG